MDRPARHVSLAHRRDRRGGDLPQQLVANKADTPAPLVQAVSYLEGEYLETSLLIPQNACVEFPKSHPHRAALVALDSHARNSGAHDCHFWQLNRFDAYTSALNDEGQPILIDD